MSISKISTNGVHSLVMALLAVGSFLSFALALGGTAYASISNTRIDAVGTVELSGTEWLNGGGVDVYSNGNSAANENGNNYVNNIWSGVKWQCVEMVNRLYLANGWTSATWQGNGNTLVSSVPSGLSAENNGSISSLNPGDVITLNGGGADGHAAIINTVNNGSVQIVNQNTPAVYSSASIDSGSLGNKNAHLSMTGWAGYYIQAVIHHPGAAGSSKPPAPTSPLSWNFENLDGGSSSVGQDPGTLGLNPAAVNYNGTLQTFYYDQSHGYLMHGWNDANGWHFEHLDGAGGSSGQTTDAVGKSPSVVVYNGYLQVFYYDLTANSLRHAWTDANGWHFETLDYSGNVGAASTVAVYGTSLQLFYPNSTNGDLRHTWADSNGWHFENLDGDSASVAGQAGNYLANAGSSLASTIDSSGNLQLFYYGSTNQLLRHTWADQSGWHFENLDGGNLGTISGSSDPIGQNPSVTMDGSSIEVFSYDASAGALRHDWSDSTGWHFENLDGSSSSGPDHFTVGLYSSTTMNGSSLEVLYYDSQWHELRHAWTDASGWHFENLDGLGGSPSSREGPNMDVGSYPLAIVYGGVLQAFYYDATHGTLRHAWPQ